MNDINDVYLYVNDILRKQYSGSISPDQFNRFAGAAQILHLLIKCGVPEKYLITAGYPAMGQRRSLLIVREAPQELEASMTLSDEVYPFLTDLPITGTNNLFTLPDNYMRYRPSSYKYAFQATNPATGETYTDYRNVPFEFVTGAERTYRLYQYIKRPTPEYPIISYSNGQLLVNADQKGLVIIPSILLSYVRQPVDPFWNSTPNANDQAIYNPVGSVDFEFPKTEWEAISRRIIKYWAESIRDKEVLEVNEGAINTGQ